MKLTKKQKERIIKAAIKKIKSWESLGICNAIYESAIHETHKRLSEIKVFAQFPRFKRENAAKYFGATSYIFWWNTNKRGTRIKFLKYILTGILPKTKKENLNMNPEPEYWDNIPQFDEGNLE